MSSPFLKIYILTMVNWLLIVMSLSIIQVLQHCHWHHEIPLLTFYSGLPLSEEVKMLFSLLQIGLVVYSNQAFNRFYLNSYYDRNRLIEEVRRTDYIGGTTNTSGGLWRMINEQFVPERGDRPNINNVGEYGEKKWRSKISRIHFLLHSKYKSKLLQKDIFCING